jgi:hypothetical protein
MSKKIEEELLKLYHELTVKGHILEPYFDLIDEILNENPEHVQIFIEKFQMESDRRQREILAQIILFVEHYQPAIDFLKNEMGWDDFTGYAGFPDS